MKKKNMPLNECLYSPKPIPKSVPFSSQDAREKKIDRAVSTLTGEKVYEES